MTDFRKLEQISLRLTPAPRLVDPGEVIGFTEGRKRWRVFRVETDATGIEIRASRAEDDAEVTLWISGKD